MPFRWYSEHGKKKPGLPHAATVDLTFDLVTSHSVEVEKAYILFNIGALYNQLGGASALTGAEGVKKAAHYHQVGFSNKLTLSINLMVERCRCISADC